MAVRKEELVRNSEAAQPRPIELITENGFSIVRGRDLNGAASREDGSYTFVVRDPHGYELEIAVAIERSAVLEVFKRSAGRISTDNSYWICCAERHLSDYLWEQDGYPPADSLKVERLTPDDLDLARRWQSDGDI